jgi:hypothetical protein
MSSIGEPYTLRGEELNIRRYQNFDEYRDEGEHEEYNYILRQVNGKAVWFVNCYATESQGWVTIEEARELEKENA